MFSHSFDAEYVRPLAKAENQLLQVLVDRFRIVRKGRGFQMEVAFNEESPERGKGVRNEWHCQT